MSLPTSAAWAAMSTKEKEAIVLRLTDTAPRASSATLEKLNGKRRPSASVIVTARNYGRYLEDCLRSCQSQSVPPLEVIYSDDASADDSLAVARSIAGVRVVANPRHTGAPSSRNRGARLARGEVLLFIDGDDQLPTDFLERKLNALTPANSFAYGDVQQFGRGCAGYKNPQWTDRSVLWERNICDTSAATWAKLFWQVGGWREAPGNCWDWDLWLRLSQVAPPVHCDSLLLYRAHEANDSHTLGFAAPGKDIGEIRAALHKQAITGVAPASTAGRPRIGFLFPTLHTGGAERWLLSLLKHGAAQGLTWSGIALTAGHADSHLADEAARHAMLVGDRRVTAPAATIAGSVKEAAQLVTAESDLMICWCQEPIAELLGDFTGPVVLVSHGCCTWTERLVERQQSRATHFVAISQAAARSFRKLQAKPAILHNGIDLGRCEAKRSRAAVRKSWRLNPAEIAVAYVGRQSWEKNPLAVAYAVAKLDERYRAVYVGDGWKSAEVQQAVRHVCPNAIFTGAIEPIGDALAAIDCFVLASPSEGMSLALCEAWATGVPTVSTAVGAVPELEKKHGQLTVRVPIAATPEQLAKAVKQALSPRNRKVVERAREVTSEHYSAGAMAGRWKRYLEAVALNRR